MKRPFLMPVWRGWYGRENVIAVELHQANATSSDTSFDLKLDGNRTRQSGS